MLKNNDDSKLLGIIPRRSFSVSAFFLIIIVLIFISTTIVNNKLNKNNSIAGGDSDGNFFKQINQPKITITPSPSPFSFQELTIPYLRNQNYQSNLAELTKISNETNYTSYLTSYNSQGLKVNGLLTIPGGEPPAEGWPAVIFLHGYIPPKEYQTQKNYLAFVEYLAKNNLVVFKIDYRGHGDSEGEATGAYYSGDYIIDTLNAYSALENAEFVDKNKIYLWGHSMSGNVALRAFAAKQTIPKVVIWAGAVYTYDDFQNFRISDSSYQPPENRSEHSNNRQKLRDTYGEFDPNNWFWQQIPATNYLNNITGEIQIHHAVDDATVDIGYSRNLNQILETAGIKHQLFEYQSGGHNINGASFDQAMKRTVDFFKL